MLALALVPCSDGGGGVVEIANQLFGIEHQINSDHEHHSKNCGDDLCPPFCVCSCCSSVLDLPVKPLTQIQSLPPIPEATPLFAPGIILSSFSSAIWQPPKFS
jgi:hypothetical protein